MDMTACRVWEPNGVVTDVKGADYGKIVAALKTYVASKEEALVETRLVSGAPYVFKISSVQGVSYSTPEGRRFDYERAQALEAEAKAIDDASDHPSWLD